MQLKRNEGPFDRLVRAWIAAVLFGGGYFWAGGTVRIVLFVLAGISLFTAVTGFCGLYTLLGINTCNLKTETNSRTSVALAAFAVVMTILAVVYGLVVGAGG